MSATDVRRGVERKPSLVHVLSTLADYWRLCTCGLEIGRAGKDGWQQKCERLESELYPLQRDLDLVERNINETTNSRRRQQLEKKLAKLQAKFSLLRIEVQTKEAPIQTEWEQAYSAADAYRELFGDAREFCRMTCGIGDSELLNAALVNFDPSLLKPGQEPSKQRMSHIVSLLRSLQRHEWETQPWANPTKPTMRARRRVSPAKLREFNAQHLVESNTQTIFHRQLPVKAGGKGGEAGNERRNFDVPVEFVESDYAEPIFKSDLAFLFDVDRATIARRIQSGELRAMPGTLDAAKKVRIHGDDFPAGLKRPNERKQKISIRPNRGKRQ